MQIPVRERMIMPRAHLSRDVIERMEKASRKMTRATRRLGWPWKRFEVVRERVENPEHAANVADFIELVALTWQPFLCPASPSVSSGWFYFASVLPDSETWRKYFCRRSGCP